MLPLATPPHPSPPHPRPGSEAQHPGSRRGSGCRWKGYRRTQPGRRYPCGAQAGREEGEGGGVGVQGGYGAGRGDLPACRAPTDQYPELTIPEDPIAPAVSSIDTGLLELRGMSLVRMALVPATGTQATMMSLLRQGTKHAQQGEGAWWVSRAALPPGTGAHAMVVSLARGVPKGLGRGRARAQGTAASERQRGRWRAVL